MTQDRFFFALLASLHLGCASLVGIEDPTGDLPDSPGKAGAAGSSGGSGQGGQPQGGAGAGGSSAGQAGQGGSASEGGAGGSAGASDGGAGGLSGSSGDGGVSGGGAAGEGGAAGDAGAAGEGGNAGEGGAGEGGGGGLSGSSGDGGASGGGQGGDGGAAGGCLSGDEQGVIYVSVNGGDDGNVGNDPAKPKKTIGAAVALLKSDNVLGTTIKVCKGIYPEKGLIIDWPLSLRGGFDCCTWARTETYGYPDFDGTNETILQNKSYKDSGPNRATLTVSTSAVGNDSVIDGLTVQGFPSGGALGPSGSTGVWIADGAKPTLSHCKMDGGGASNVDAYGSVGLRVSGNARPKVSFNSINGGSGQATSAGYLVASVGVLVEGGASPEIQDNTIDGGTGTGFEAIHGSVGVRWLSNAPSEANLIRNHISGGSGGCLGNGALNSAGLHFGNVDSPSGVFSSNFIDGGAGTGCQQGPVGVVLWNIGAVSLDGNRIYGGKGAGSSTVSGVLIENSTATLTNNMILGGSKAGNPGQSRGVGVLLGSGTLTLRHNTIHPGFGAANAATPALRTSTISNGLVVEGNLFLGGSLPNHTVIEHPNACGVLTSLKGNLFVGMSVILGACTNNNFSLSSVEAAETQLNGITAGIASSNLALRADCAGDAGCRIEAACEDPASNLDCLRSVIPSWTKEGGFDQLWGDGWLLSDGSRCQAVQGKLDDVSKLFTDFQGTARTSPPSVGAHEYDGTCVP